MSAVSRARVLLLAAGLAMGGCPRQGPAVGVPTLDGGGSLVAALDELGFRWREEGVVAFRALDRAFYGVEEEVEEGHRVCLYAPLLDVSPAELSRVRLMAAVWNDAIESSATRDGPTIEIEMWQGRELVQLAECVVFTGARSERRASGPLVRLVRRKVENLARAEPRVRAYLEAILATE